MPETRFKYPVNILCFLVMILWVSSLRQSARAISFFPPPENFSLRQNISRVSRSGRPVFLSMNSDLLDRRLDGPSRSSTLFIPYPDSHTTLAERAETNSRDEDVFIPRPDRIAPEGADSTVSPDNAPRNNAPRDNGNSANGVLANPALSMQAVIPSSLYGLTISERPIFMVYLPSSIAHQAIFRLKDESQNIVHQHTIPLGNTAGILTIQLPDDAPALVPDQYYQWFFTLQDKEHLTPASPFVDAWVKRIEPPEAVVQAQLRRDDLAVAEALAQLGIWYDTAAIVAALKSEQPSSTMVEHWQELLTSVDLSNLADAPFLAE